jgi:hypothetical protein
MDGRAALEVPNLRDFPHFLEGVFLADRLAKIPMPTPPGARTP